MTELGWDCSPDESQTWNARDGNDDKNPLVIQAIAKDSVMMMMAMTMTMTPRSSPAVTIFHEITYEYIFVWIVARS